MKSFGLQSFLKIHLFCFISSGAKGEPGLAVAEKGLQGPRGQDGEPGLPGSNGTQILSDNQNPANPQPKREDSLLSHLFLCCISCHQVIQASLGSLDFQVYQEPKVTLDSQVLDYQDPPELKVPTSLFFSTTSSHSLKLFFASITAYLPFISVHRILRYPRSARSSWWIRQTRSGWTSRPARDTWN